MIIGQDEIETGIEICGQSCMDEKAEGRRQLPLPAAQTEEDKCQRERPKGSGSLFIVAVWIVFARSLRARRQMALC